MVGRQSGVGEGRRLHRVQVTEGQEVAGVVDQHVPRHAAIGAQACRHRGELALALAIVLQPLDAAAALAATGRAIDGDRLADFQPGDAGAQRLHPTRVLVTEGEGWLEGHHARLKVVDEVQVGVAQAGATHPHQHLAWTGFGLGDVTHLGVVLPLGELNGIHAIGLLWLVVEYQATTSSSPLLARRPDPCCFLQLSLSAWGGPRMGKVSPRGASMTFIGLVWHNVSARRMRAALTAGAVAIGVMAVVALGTLTSSLEQSATGFLKAGNADFTIAQKHTDSLLNSLISSDDIASIAKVDGVEDSIGALIELDKYDAGHPTVVQVGLAPDAQKRFGVVVLEGRSYAAQSETEVMLGYTLAESIDKKTGDTLTMDGHQYRVTGLYRTNGVSYGNSTMMFPLAALQGRYQAAGQVTLGFVKLAPGASSAQVRKSIDTKFPQLATVNSETDFGRVDNTLVLISAGNTGGSILAAVIAITGVLNTSLLSFFERIREFGVLRSIGWTRRRIVSLVLGESLIVSLVGATIGVFLGWVAINLLQNLPELRGVFHPIYTASIFTRSLVFAIGVAFLGAIYPALRAAFLSPVEAMRRE